MEAGVLKRNTERLLELLILQKKNTTPVGSVVQHDAHFLHLNHETARPLERVVRLVFDIVASHLLENVSREMRLDHLSD